MVAYSFDKQFITPIREGTKRQTIRGERKRHAHPGEKMQLYTAMRTQYCRQIGEATCYAVSEITIDFAANRIAFDWHGGTTTVFPGGLDDFARSDGFADWAGMTAFWKLHHPMVQTFCGVLVRWIDFRLPA